MATALAIVSIVAAGVGAVQQRKAAKVQKRQNEVSNRIAANTRMRSVRRSIAAGRIRRGQIQAAGFSQGVSGGTAVAGALGGLASDQASAIGASNQQFTGQQTLASLSNEITDVRSSAATFGAISNIAGAASQPQAFEALSNFDPFGQ